MKKHENIVVRKASGNEEFFSLEKLRNSLLNSKATQQEADDIINIIKERLHNGISTKEIYKIAFRLLKKQSPHKASRYNLKQGLMELGPSGFPFERYISEIFIRQGYQTEVGVLLKGKCVTHEIDVICKKEDTFMVMECKYKNQQGVSVDVKIPLYIHSRFQDLLDNGVLQKPYKNFKGWIVTNSKFTDDAKAFAKCKNIELLGWDYPYKNSLKDLIDNTGFYPLTSLSTLSSNEKTFLLDKGIVLVKDMHENERLLSKAGISTNRIKNILDESNKLTIKD